jgi:hypothetical protein
MVLIDRASGADIGPVAGVTSAGSFIVVHHYVKRTRGYMLLDHRRMGRHPQFAIGTVRDDAQDGKWSIR